jgi:cell division GTPase FtsZ
MNTTEKHFRFINSKTGNVIFYSSLSADLSAEELKEELKKIQERVASQNNVYLGTVYWEEIPEEK